MERKSNLGTKKASTKNEKSRISDLQKKNEDDAIGRKAKSISVSRIGMPETTKKVEIARNGRSYTRPNPKGKEVAVVKSTRSNNKGLTDIQKYEDKVGYTVLPIIPAEKKELVSVAKAMNRDQFAPRLKKLFDPERTAALEAIESNIYISWRCKDYNHDCIRVDSDRKCFCGHSINQHYDFTSAKIGKTPCEVCPCKRYEFIPSRPEDVGEFWLAKRRNFDASTWRAKCRCKHTHEEHNADQRKKCKIKSCSCFRFDSNFLCAACDRHWEEHQTYFETSEERKMLGLTYGESFVPFHEMPDLRNIVLTGDETDDTVYNQLAYASGAAPVHQPTPLALQLRR